MLKIGKKSKAESLGDITKFWPPFLVYALARRSYRTRKPDEPVIISLAERSAISGLPIRTIVRIGGMLSWGSLSHDTIDAFCRGCNFSFFHTKVHRKFIIANLKSQKQRFRWLNHWQWKTFLKRTTEYEALMAKEQP